MASGVRSIRAPRPLPSPRGASPRGIHPLLALVAGFPPRSTSLLAGVCPNCSAHSTRACGGASSPPPASGGEIRGGSRVGSGGPLDADEPLPFPLRSLRNVVDRERSGLARYFSTGVRKRIGGVIFCQYKQSVNSLETCKVSVGGVNGSFTFRGTLTNRISSGVTGLNDSLSCPRVASARSFSSSAASVAKGAKSDTFAASGLDYTDIPNAQIKKVTANRLLASEQTIPHYYLTVDTRVDNLIKLRGELNPLQDASGGKKISINDLVIKAAALALRKVPLCDSSWTNDFICQYNNVNINVAVQTEHGLFVPVVRDTDKKGLGTMGEEVKQLAQRAMDNSLKPQDYEARSWRSVELLLDWHCQELLHIAWDRSCRVVPSPISKFGTGLNHVGLNDRDGILVEKLFSNNKVQVLVCTVAGVSIFQLTCS